MSFNIYGYKKKIFREQNKTGLYINEDWIRVHDTGFTWAEDLDTEITYKNIRFQSVFGGSESYHIE